MPDTMHVRGAIWRALLRLAPLPLLWKTSYRCVDPEVHRCMVQQLNAQSHRVRVEVGSGWIR